MCWDYDDPSDYDPQWEYDDADPCDHEDYDVDILTGRAHCCRCGEAWWLTGEQLSQEHKWQAEQYEAIVAEEDRLAAERMTGSTKRLERGNPIRSERNKLMTVGALDRPRSRSK